MNEIVGQENRRIPESSHSIRETIFVFLEEMSHDLGEQHDTEFEQVMVVKLPFLGHE